MPNTYSAGIVTAYGAAKRAGYTGTYEQFCQDQAGFAEAAQQVREDKESVEQTVQTFEETTFPEAVQSVENEGTRQIGLVGDAGTAQIGNVNAAGVTAVGAVNSAGTTQTNAVNQAGTTQVNAVNSAGTTQVGNVNTAGSTQVQAVEDKGEEVLESIPEDYTELVDQVNDPVTGLDNKAPVIVNTASGDIATFADGADGMPIKSLVATIEPVQAAGTPSPTNPLPISGYTGLNVYRESSYDTEADPTVTVNWEDAAGTVYGGTLDIISGKMIVDRRYGFFGPQGSGATLLIANEPLTAYPNTYVYSNSAIGNAIVPNESDQITQAICSHLPSISRSQAGTGSSMVGIFQYHSGDNNQFRLAFPREEQFSTNEKLNEWFQAQITAGTPLAVCFPLKGTIEYQLTPQEVTTLLGNNVVYTDVGPVTVDYPADTGLVVSQQKNAINQKQDATSYVTLSGTIVTQTGADNTMYLCGELAELTFTAPATGITAVRFTSGTTPTVVTLNGITMPDDWAGAEASTTYEINVLNGLGVWQSWT